MSGACEFETGFLGEQEVKSLTFCDEDGTWVAGFDVREFLCPAVIVVAALCLSFWACVIMKAFGILPFAWSWLGLLGRTLACLLLVSIEIVVSEAYKKMA